MVWVIWCFLVGLFWLVSFAMVLLVLIGVMWIVLLDWWFQEFSLARGGFPGFSVCCFDLALIYLVF